MNGNGGNGKTDSARWLLAILERSRDTRPVEIRAREIAFDDGRPAVCRNDVEAAAVQLRQERTG